jgi:hypothetical protein
LLSLEKIVLSLLSLGSNLSVTIHMTKILLKP